MHTVFFSLLNISSLLSISELFCAAIPSMPLSCIDISLSLVTLTSNPLTSSISRSFSSIPRFMPFSGIPSAETHPPSMPPCGASAKNGSLSPLGDSYIVRIKKYCFNTGSLLCVSVVYSSYRAEFSHYISNILFNNRTFSSRKFCHYLINDR